MAAGTVVLVDWSFRAPLYYSRQNWQRNGEQVIANFSPGIALCPVYLLQEYSGWNILMPCRQNTSTTLSHSFVHSIYDY